MLIHVDNDVDPYTQLVAGVLRDAKERSGLSFSGIADRTEIARATIVRVLRGERPITVFYLHELARVFELSPSDVLTEADRLDALAGIDTPANVVHGRFGVGGTSEDLDAVARRRDEDLGEDDQ